MVSDVMDALIFISGFLCIIISSMFYFFFSLKGSLEFLDAKIYNLENRILSLTRQVEELRGELKE